MNASSGPLIVHLADLIDSCQTQPDVCLLPICHTSTIEALRTMIASDEIRPVDYDKTFEESLLFFFYGRARYIPERAVKDIYSRGNPPVVLLFEIEQIEPPPKRLVAFDSGGYSLYNLSVPLAEFTLMLNTKDEEIKKYIRQIYTENENYIQKRLTVHSADYPFCTPLEWLNSLYLDQEDMEERDYGEQAYTIEIQYDRPIQLKPILIILPSRFTASPEAIEQTKRAFHLDDESVKKKIVIYNENATIAHSYFKIVDMANSYMAELLKPKPS